MMLLLLCSCARQIERLSKALHDRSLLVNKATEEVTALNGKLDAEREKVRLRWLLCIVCGSGKSGRWLGSSSHCRHACFWQLVESKRQLDELSHSLSAARGEASQHSTRVSALEAQLRKTQQKAAKAEKAAADAKATVNSRDNDIAKLEASIADLRQQVVILFQCDLTFLVCFCTGGRARACVCECVGVVDHC